MSTVKASDVLVAALEKQGVAYVFGIPGEENLDLLESIRESKIQLILTRHEQAAGFMAATIGRLTGHVGVCLATLGPGAANLMTAAAYAQLGAMPMMMITGQKPIKTSKQGAFQIVDVVEMMKPVTKSAHQLVHGGTIPARVTDAFRLAEEERPGAVHLELPEDIARELVEEPMIFPRMRARRPAAEEKAVALAVARIEQSRRPLLLIGAGANRNLTRKSLRGFIEKTGIPFFCTQMGKGVVDGRHPLHLGTAALSDHEIVHEAVAEADLVINVGHDVVEKPPFFMHPSGFDVIHVNYSSAAVEPVYFPQLEVVGDIANALWQMCETISRQSHWSFGGFDALRERQTQELALKADDASFPLKPQRLVADVRACMPDEGIIALDNGMYKIWFARNYKAHLPNTVLLDNALATMGAGLPSAMAAKLVFPDAPVIAICGDGGFMMNSQELETAMRLALDLVVLVVRDDGYGMIKWKQGEAGFPAYGLEFGNPDFVAYAQSYGATGHRIETSETFRPVLERALAEGGVHVIEVPIDYAENDVLLPPEAQAS